MVLDPPPRQSRADKGRRGRKGGVGSSRGGGGMGGLCVTGAVRCPVMVGGGGSSKGVGVPRVWWALQLGGHLLIPLFERLGGEGVPASFPPTPQGVAP